MSQSTNFTKDIEAEEKNINEEKEYIKKCRKTFIKCIRHNKEKSNGEVIEIKSYLADKIKAGEIYLGYDLNALNLDSENSLFLDANKYKLPDIILVRKKPEIEIKGKKLKRLNNLKENENKKNKKKGNEDEDKENLKTFIEEIYDEKDLRDYLNNEKDDNLEYNKNKEEDLKVGEERKNI